MVKLQIRMQYVFTVKKALFSKLTVIVALAPYFWNIRASFTNQKSLVASTKLRKLTKTTLLIVFLKCCVSKANSFKYRFTKDNSISQFRHRSLEKGTFLHHDRHFRLAAASGMKNRTYETRWFVERNGFPISEVAPPDCLFSKGEGLVFPFWETLVPLSTRASGVPQNPMLLWNKHFKSVQNPDLGGRWLVLLLPRTRVVTAISAN